METSKQTKTTTVNPRYIDAHWDMLFTSLSRIIQYSEAALHSLQFIVIYCQDIRPSIPNVLKLSFILFINE